MQVSSQLLCQSSVAGRGWFLSAARCSAEFRKEEKTRICGSHQRHPADGWVESDVGRKKQGAKGGNRTRAKGRQLKIHICVKLE